MGSRQAEDSMKMEEARSIASTLSDVETAGRDSAGADEGSGVATQ